MIQQDSNQAAVSRLQDWIQHQALPYWAGNGVDPSGKGVWEAMDHAGEPMEHLPKRVRVQARQAFVFALAEQLGFGAYRQNALDAFAFLISSGFDEVNGRFFALLSSTGEPLDRTQDLYDLAFILLALTSFYGLGEEALVRPWIPKWRNALAAHQANHGWLETPAGKTPRRQNPHMHLFEASLAFYAASGDTDFRKIAEKCLDLFIQRFLDQRQGWLLEYFDQDLLPLHEEQQSVEPGHMMEWVYLLAEYERVTKRATDVNLRALFDRAVALGFDSHLGLIQDIAPVFRASGLATLRLWPQTEFVKAAAVLRARGEVLPGFCEPHAIINNIFARYLSTDVSGGWYDQLSHQGEVVSATMPASSFYHIFSAYKCLLEYEPS